ncbi:MAG TPA: sugar ABC transporter substrate-binding protein [Xanthobacteraceae bacterium]
MWFHSCPGWSTRTCRAACLAAALAGSSPVLPAPGETIATFTRNRTNPILRGVRIGAEIAATAYGAQAVHYIPRSEAPSEQLALVDELIVNKPDALVLVPYDPKAMLAAVDRLNAAGIPVTNVSERLAGGSVVSFVGTDDYQLALSSARYLMNALAGKGNVVILEGPDNLAGSVARVRGYKDALEGFPAIKLLASKSANYARASAVDVMKSLLRSYPQIDGILAANDQMAIGAIAQLKRANRHALVIGMNASREAIELIKSGDLLGSGDYDGFLQGCLGVEIALRNLRKQAVPKELMLKPVVVDKTSYRPYELAMEQRSCPSLESITGN